MVEAAQVRATVACFHCGHTSGEVEVSADRPLASGVFLPAAQPSVREQLHGRKPRCARCGGPTYFEGLRAFQPREPRLVTWRGRGRPPKNAIRITQPPIDGAKRRRPIVLYALVVDGDPAIAATLLKQST